MAETTMRVRPWPGLILDGIPPGGADIPRDLAETWIGNRLVVPMTKGVMGEAGPETIAVVPTPGRPSKSAVKTRKRRRTR